MIGSRDIVKRIAHELAPYKKKEILLDFEGVEIVSRSAADELINIKAKFSYLKFINLNPELTEMLRRVAASKIVSEKPDVPFKPKKITLSSLFT